MLQIALDVEGVLSNTHKAAYERSDILKPEHDEEWGFPTEELYDEFMHVSQNLWHNHWEKIPPMEDPKVLQDVTESLYEYGHTVDIVTHRRNVDDQVQAWLDDKRIVYKEFHAPSEEKDELDYDLYVDDKPALAERIKNDPQRAIVLRDRPYNQSVETIGEPRIERVHTLKTLKYIVTDYYNAKHIQQITKDRAKL